MAMEITNNYNSYVASSMTGSVAANSTQKKETEKTPETANSKSKSTTAYMSELAKLAPSVEFRVGNTYASAKTGKTLTINPKLLEKMQNDPEKEKEMKELIKGVETMTRLSDSINNASGWKTVYRHSYIDENGKYCHVALIRNEHGYKMSEKLREERRKNSEKWIEKSKEKAAQKKEEIKTESNQSYVKKLQSKVSYVNLEIGYGLNMKKDKKVGTITMNPKLLEKMKNDPEAEKKYTQLIKDIERAEKTVNSYYNSLGGVVEHTSHWYIDENGNYTHFGYVKRDDKLNKKLRLEAKKNTEKWIQKSREKAKEKAKEQEAVREKKAEEDMKDIMDTIRKENEAAEKRENPVGANMDMKI